MPPTGNTNLNRHCQGASTEVVVCAGQVPLFGPPTRARPNFGYEPRSFSLTCAGTSKSTFDFPDREQQHESAVKKGAFRPFRNAPADFDATCTNNTVARNSIALGRSIPASRGRRSSRLRQPNTVLRHVSFQGTARAQPPMMRFVTNNLASTSPETAEKIDIAGREASSRGARFRPDLTSK